MFIRSVRGVWMTSENQARISHYRIRIKQEKKKKIINHSQTGERVEVTQKGGRECLKK